MHFNSSNIFVIVINAMHIQIKSSFEHNFKDLGHIYIILYKVLMTTMKKSH
jgi:hypothetical protein